MQSRLIRNPLAGRASQCHSVSQKKGRKFFRGKELLDYTRSTGIFIKSRPFFLVLPGIRSQRRESGCISVPQGRTPGCTRTVGSARSVRGSGLRLVTAWLQASRRPPGNRFRILLLRISEISAGSRVFVATTLLESFPKRFAGLSPWG